MSYVLWLAGWLALCLWSVNTSVAGFCLFCFVHSEPVHSGPLGHLRDIATPSTPPPPWPEASHHPKPVDSLWPKYYLHSPGASIASSVGSVRSQLSDLSSHVPSSAALVIYCQLVSPEVSTGGQGGEKGVHELSFHGAVERAVMDTSCPQMTEVSAFSTKNCLCPGGLSLYGSKWAPRSKGRSLPPGTVRTKAFVVAPDAGL